MNGRAARGGWRTADCILGETLDENRWDTEVDLAGAASILARCTEIEPRLIDAEVLEHVVGLPGPADGASRGVGDRPGPLTDVAQLRARRIGRDARRGCAEDVLRLANTGG